MGKYIASFLNVLHSAESLIKTPAGNNGKFLGEMVNAKEKIILTLIFMTFFFFHPSYLFSPPFSVYKFWNYSPLHIYILFLKFKCA